MGLGARRQGGSASKADLSRRLRIAAEHLGPTYIKLGQIISSGEGLFPEELVTEFKKCRDQVPAETWSDVRAVVEAELGRPLEAVFSEFDREPLAAASIAQVHAATLRTGERVVVKVQRPVGRPAWCTPTSRSWRGWRRSSSGASRSPRWPTRRRWSSCSPRRSPRSSTSASRPRTCSTWPSRSTTSASSGYVVPRPHPTLVTPRVLVMERLDGFAFDDVAGMVDAGVDTENVVRTGMIGFMEGAMIHGIFHGDLHGGNLFVLPDGRVALLDFGIVGRMDELKRLAFLRLLVGATMNDVKGQLAAIRDLGALPARHRPRRRDPRPRPRRARRSIPPRSRRTR